MSQNNPVEHALLSLANGKKHLQGDRLIHRLERKTKLDRGEVIKQLASLRADSSVQCADWLRGEPIGRVVINIAVKHTENERLLINRADALNFQSKDTDALLPLANKLTNWSPRDIQALLIGLDRLRSDIPKLHGQSTFLISSRYLMGSAKLLNSLPSKALKTFGIDVSLLSGSPSYVVVAGPSNPEAVILVENPQSMELAVQSGMAANLAWIATYGYGLSNAKNETGEQLSNLMEYCDELTPLVRAGKPPSINELVSHSNIYFWGDLDLEGFKIFRRLRSWIPNLSLSGLYHPMIAKIINEEDSHPYHLLTGKETQKKWRCDEESIQSLLDLCCERAIDQESVTAEELKRYAGLPFE